MEGWHDFFVAVVGAAAALAGLLFVGVSINLNRMLEFGQLPGKALLALLKLILVLVVGVLGLVPDQPSVLLGAEWLMLGLFSVIWFAAIQWRSWRLMEPQYRREQLWWNLLTQGAALFVLLSGLRLLSGDATGLYWMIPGLLLCFGTAVQDSWVLLIEINR